MSDKQILRKNCKVLRSTLKDEGKDAIIAENLMNNFEFGSFFVYLSFSSEVGTQPLIEKLKLAKKTVCVPFVKGDHMLSVPLTDKLVKGAFGILSPEEGEERTCEAAIVPMLAFNEKGYRLGYGGGYYDRYFSSHPDVFRLGIAYAGQYTDEAFQEPFDEPLDAIVTEEGVRIFAGGRRTCGS